MPKSKTQKMATLEVLNEKIAKSKSVVFATFNGLPVKENEALRRELKQQSGDYFVAKKTLLELAFKKAKFEGLNLRKLTGQIAVIFGFGDEVAPAKLVAKYKKSSDGKLDFAGGILENKFLSIDEVTALSALPGREELYAKLVGSINAPVSGFVNVLAGNLRGLVNVLKAVGEKK